MFETPAIIAVIKLKAVYTRDMAVASAERDKIASSCATKIACVNGPLERCRLTKGGQSSRDLNSKVGTGVRLFLK